MSGRARVGLVAIAVIAGVFIAVYFWRLEVATRAIQRVLEERGVPSPMLRVSALGLSGITIRDIRLGEPAEFEAALLRANYAWWNSDAGLPTLEIQDAQWSIDLREGAAPFGALQGPLDALFAPSEEAASAAAPDPPGTSGRKIAASHSHGRQQRRSPCGSRPRRRRGRWGDRRWGPTRKQRPSRR